VSPNSNEVHVYGWMGSEVRWSLLDKLREHVERVTGVDWAPVSNRIVTCGSVSIFLTIAECYIIRLCTGTTPPVFIFYRVDLNKQ